MVMVRTRKAAMPPESAQEVREGLGVCMDTSGTLEAAEGAANGQIIGPADASELAGCQDEGSLQDGVLTEYAAPCGVCRQVMMEFCDPEEFEIILAVGTEDYKIYTLQELLPQGFGPENL